jgi:hypothetical protein
MVLTNFLITGCLYDLQINTVAFHAQRSNRFNNNAVKTTSQSLSGSGFTFIDSIGKNTQAAKDYIKVKLGWNEEQASRIVDMTQKDGPKSVEELKTQLLVIASRPDSKKLVLDDLKEAMTGYGT